jgi:hypothetical protein
MEAQEWQWARSIYSEEGTAVVSKIDFLQSDQLLMVGSFNGQYLSLGRNKLQSKGLEDIFIIKANEQMDISWSFSIGGENVERLDKVATDDQGNIYLAIHFYSLTIDVGNFNIINKGAQDAMLVKINMSNQVEWVYQIGTIQTDQISAMALDSKGNIFISGYTYEPNINDKGITTFLTKISPKGDVKWSKMNAKPQGYSLITDSNLFIDRLDNIYFNISVYGEVNFDIPFGLKDKWTSTTLKFNNAGSFIQNYATPFLSNATSNIDHGIYNIDRIDTSLYVNKFDFDFNLLWSKSLERVSLYGSPATGRVNFSNILEIDKVGNVYVTGPLSEFKYDTVVIESDTFLLPNYYSDIGFIKLNKEGDLLFKKFINGVYDDFGTSVAIKNENEIYLAGGFNSDYIIIGKQTLVNSNALQAVLVHRLGTFYKRNTYSFIALLSLDSLSIIENIKSQDLLLYPNPTYNYFYLNSSNFDKLPINIQILSYDGRIIRQDVKYPSWNEIKIDISDLPKGVYILQYSNSQTHGAQRFVKY